MEMSSVCNTNVPETPAYFPRVSRTLGNLLNGLGVSSSARKCRERLCLQRDVLWTIDQSVLLGNDCAIYTCGSQTECSTTPGLKSDCDSLICNNEYNIISDLSEWSPSKVNLLMCEDDQTHPGYVKLQVTCANAPVAAYQCSNNINLCIDRVGRTVFPNTTFRRPLDPNDVIQGPASSSPARYGQISNDFVPCLPMHKFPIQAVPWVQHRQLNGLLPEHFIQKIVNHGCLVVAVGHALSQESHLEWRLSFSLAERDIMHSLNMTQLKCYVLLKLIVKSLIKPEMLDHCLSSYHCKTCIFYMVENTRRSLWRPDNLLLVLTMCLQTLKMWVAQGHCPQYFIPENNLFDTKIIGHARHKLQQLLQKLLSEDCRFLLRIKIDDLGDKLAKGCTHTIPPHVLTQYTFECKRLLDGVYGTVLLYTASLYKEILYAVDRDSGGRTELIIPQIHQILKQILPVCSISERLDDVLSSVCNFMKFSMGVHFLAQFHTQVDVEHIPEFFSLLESLTTDVTSSHLKLASIRYANRQYLQAENILAQTVSAYKHYTLTICTCYDFTAYKINTNFVEKILSEDPNAEEMVQECTAFCVMYLPSEAVHVPHPMRYEMFRSFATQPESRDEDLDYWYDWMVIDSLPFMYYLQYLCYTALRKSHCRRTALANLIWVIKQKYQLNYLGHRETALNLLGDCYMRCGMVNKAYRAWATSMNMYKWTYKQPHNAAKWHLAILFNKLCQLSAS